MQISNAVRCNLHGIAFTEITGFFYIPEINAPYVQCDEGGPPRTEPSKWEGDGHGHYCGGGHNHYLSRDTDYVFVWAKSRCQTFLQKPVARQHGPGTISGASSDTPHHQRS